MSAQIKEQPVLFSSPMIRAILENNKTQTRRIVKPQPVDGGAPGDSYEWHGGLSLVKAGYGAAYVHSNWNAVEKAMLKICKYQVGDRLWVRETFAVLDRLGFADHRRKSIAYNADHQYNLLRLRPSIFMPRWASRITLEITGVRVERLQDISEADALAEGVEKNAGDEPLVPDTSRGCYRLLWDSINDKGSWDKNPFVWVVEFRKL